MGVFQRPDFSSFLKRLKCRKSKSKDFYKFCDKHRKRTPVEAKEIERALEFGCLDQLMLRVFSSALRGDRKKHKFQDEACLLVERFQEMVQTVFASNAYVSELDKEDISTYLMFYNIMTDLAKAHIRTRSQKGSPDLKNYFDILSQVNKMSLSRALCDIFFAECYRDYSSDRFTADVGTHAKILVMMLSIPNLQILQEFTKQHNTGHVFQFFNLKLPSKLLNSFAQSLIIALRQDLYLCSAAEVSIVRDVVANCTVVLQFAFEHFAISQKLQRSHKRVRRFSLSNSFANCPDHEHRGFARYRLRNLSDPEKQQPRCVDETLVTERKHSNSSETESGRQIKTVVGDSEIGVIKYV